MRRPSRTHHRSDEIITRTPPAKNTNAAVAKQKRVSVPVPVQRSLILNSVAHRVRLHQVWPWLPQTNSL